MSTERSPRQCCHRLIGRPAQLWRAGFACGAVDALRLAAREIDDPHVRALLDRLAEYYDRDSDEYDICGGGR
jgi:hypothetical protein